MEEEAERYTILQEGIIGLLAEDKDDFFIKCMAHNFLLEARKWGCHLKISARRLAEARDYWLEDTNRTLARGMSDGTDELDHFKHAGFISFWLRRRLPINLLTFLVDEAGQDFTEEQKFFSLYANEICAFQICLQICIFYHIGLVEGEAATDSVVSSQLPLPQLTDLGLTKNFLADMVMMLKHKNVSPHGLYLIYRSLFTTLFPQKPKDSGYIVAA